MTRNGKIFTNKQLLQQSIKNRNLQCTFSITSKRCVVVKMAPFRRWNTDRKIVSRCMNRPELSHVEIGTVTRIRYDICTFDWTSSFCVLLVCSFMNISPTFKHKLEVSGDAGGCGGNPFWRCLHPFLHRNVLFWSLRWSRFWRPMPGVWLCCTTTTPIVAKMLAGLTVPNPTTTPTIAITLHLLWWWTSTIAFSALSQRFETRKGVWCKPFGGGGDTWRMQLGSAIAQRWWLVQYRRSDVPWNTAMKILLFLKNGLWSDS